MRSWLLIVPSWSCLPDGAFQIVPSRPCLPDRAFQTMFSWSCLPDHDLLWWSVDFSDGSPTYHCRLSLACHSLTCHSLIGHNLTGHSPTGHSSQTSDFQITKRTMFGPSYLASSKLMRYSSWISYELSILVDPLAENATNMSLC